MALTPIQGASSFFASGNSTYTNATGGGVWSIGNSAIATIDASRGIATGVSQGQTQVIYTVGSQSTALNIQVNVTGRISNGFNPTLVLQTLNQEVLWPSQGISQSGRYYQPVSHPVLDETILKELCNVSAYPDYPTFLQQLNNSVVLDCVNSVYNKPTLIDPSALLFARSDIMLVTQPVQNINQFVGIKMQISAGAYGIKVAKLMLFFTEDVTFTMYRYNDFDLPPLYEIQVTAKAYQQVTIPLQNNVYLNYLTPDDNMGGIVYFGYYQADLGTAQAIYYPCYVNQFHPVVAWAFSAPVVVDQLGQRNFNRAVVGANNLTYGLNLEIATYVDDTENIVQNPSLWDNLFILKMACKVIELCKLSYKTNAVQRAVQGLGGIDELYTQLNGRAYDRNSGTPKIVGLYEKVNDAIETVKQGFEPEYFGGVGLIRS